MTTTFTYSKGRIAVKYSDDQERDDHGRFAGPGGGGGGGSEGTTQADREVFFGPDLERTARTFEANLDPSPLGRFASREEALAHMREKYPDAMVQGATQQNNSEFFGTEMERGPFPRTDTDYAKVNTPPETQMIDIDKLMFSLQPDVYPGVVMKYLENPGSSGIKVVERGGRYVVWDGMHRATAAYMAGETQIKASVVHSPEPGK